jgi:hypothetical protein
MDKQPDLNDYEDLLPPEDNFEEEDAANAKNGNASKK